jgi:flagella basal body P-ring formation protein FlgA
MAMRTMMLLPALALTLFFALPAAAAGRQAKIMDEPALAAIFREIVIHHTSFPAEDLKIANFTAEPSSLTIPDGARGYRLINQVHGQHLGRKTLQVTILVDGKEFGIIRMRGDVQLFGEVTVAAKALARDTLLAETDIEIIRRDVSFLGPGILTDTASALGKRLKTSVQPGSVLYSRYLEKPPLVHRGDLVTIQARTGQLEVTAPGQARGAGAEGDLIRVKNLMSRRIVQATVQGTGLVEVDL